jgi:transposase
MFVALKIEDRIPENHPLRKVKRWADEILVDMRADLAAAYSSTGRPGIPPEQLLKAMLLRTIYSIPSDRRLMEAIEFNVLYRWFLDHEQDAAAWTPEVFSMNRERFLEHGLVRKFFDRVVAAGIEKKLASNDHFTVDGTLVRSLASQKSVERVDGKSDANKQVDAKDGAKPKTWKKRKKNKSKNNKSGDGGAGAKADDKTSRDTNVDWRGERRTNETHRSRTDPEARFARKGNGKEAHLSHSMHVLMENRSGLCLDVKVDAADGKAERRGALEMLKRFRRRHGFAPATLGADAGYDDGTFLRELEKSGVTPHVAMKRGRAKAKNEKGDARRRAARRVGQVGYELSQRVRKRVEQVIGWTKTVAGQARTRFIGRPRIEMDAMIAGAAYNLLRMTRLVA